MTARARLAFTLRRIADRLQPPAQSATKIAPAPYQSRTSFDDQDRLLVDASVLIDGCRQCGALTDPVLHRHETTDAELSVFMRPQAD